MFARLFSKKPKHDRLSQDNSESLDSETLLPSSKTSAPPKSSSLRSSIEFQTAVKTLVVCTIVYFGVCIWLVLSDTAPVVRDVVPGWHTQQFNGSFLHENVYRQAAGPEVDAAWKALGVSYRSVVIPESEAKQSGIRHDQVKISQEYGGGFPANVEGLHHLHCLVWMENKARDY
ncbi:hypothetical protein N0V94_003182 [Neodidymelliopsis sp. IMI 364377]|nr:hypothetical protein N0V94_003182 [Neodidymelliopsis sp. IMI 364377]